MQNHSKSFNKLFNVGYSIIFASLRGSRPFRDTKKSSVLRPTTGLESLAGKLSVCGIGGIKPHGSLQQRPNQFFSMKPHMMVVGHNYDDDDCNYDRYIRPAGQTQRKKSCEMASLIYYTTTAIGGP